MDRIGPADTAAFVEALRRVARGSPRRPETSKSKQQAPAIQDLRDVLAGLVGGVDPDDDDSMARARHSVLRAILSREWGASAEGDPAFAAMVEAVESGIERSERLRDVFREAVTRLQSKPGG